MRSVYHGLAQAASRGDPAVLIITVQVNAPAGQAVGIKEDLAMYLERFGDIRVVSVTEEQPQYRQMGLYDARQPQRGKKK